MKGADILSGGFARVLFYGGFGFAYVRSMNANNLRYRLARKLKFVSTRITRTQGALSSKLQIINQPNTRFIVVLFLK